jgi:spore maturation protein CgeB
MDEGLPELYSRAKINISIDHTLERGYWSDRNAQIMVCSGFVLFRYVPLSENTFRDRVIYFYSIEDCLAKIKYYLEHDQERRQQALYSGWYARDNMYVGNRVKDLLTIVESL